MIYVKNKRCEKDGCDKQPQFDINGGKGRFCSTHKLINMIDVKNKRCEKDGCDSSASYGNIGYSKSHCAKHKNKGMIMKPNAKCHCKEQAIWGTNFIPKHCDLHKTEDEINLVEKPCNSCGLLYILDKNNKCENCDPDVFTKTRLAKQNNLMSYLDAQDLKGTSTDIMIDKGACGKERPDRVYDFDDKIIILECDENQHKDRECVCEQTRMINISQSFGGIPVYFIRWNPDEYLPENSKKDQENIKKRYKLVSDLIKSIKSNKTVLPKGLVSVLYMYYDGWNFLNDENWKVLIKLS